ncbi:MAG: hypothetical protein JKY90_08945 [Gammaproteobacteria bacterium]|nr:hypothetical protein [Gammaproteobacteria bacterium]
MIDTITLPRPMVNALLHQAQLAGKNSALGLITEKDNKIIGYYPVNESVSSDDIGKILKKIQRNKEQIFAVYRSGNSKQYELLSKVLDEENLLQLSISQDIKGVLQLTGLHGKSKAHEIQLLIS